MMATWLHSRSTISSTCEVRKIVAPRAIMRVSMAFSVPAAMASTPSNGSSRNRIFGPWMTAAASASFDYSHGMQKKLALAAAVIHGPKILFLDEPFEGVDAIAAGTLKAMLTRMTDRGATIFLTSHVLEIVERLCSHVAIIDRGKLVAHGSLEELRAGVAASAHVGEAAAGEKLTLEQIFLAIVGPGASERRPEEELSWLV